MTKDGFGFNNGSGSLDTDKPHLTPTGINAGDKEISNVKSAINPATNGGQPDFVTRLGTANTDKPNSAATVKDLYDLSQVPLTFAGDNTGTNVTRKLGDTLKVQGGQTDTSKLTDNNIGVVASGDTLNIKLAKTLTGLDAVNTETLNANQKVKVGTGTNTAELINSGLTFNQPNAGGTSAGKTFYGVEGLKFTEDKNKRLDGKN